MTHEQRLVVAAHRHSRYPLAVSLRRDDDDSD